jgi:NAD-dependent dihydropyrimidine dehydrogenase PreA subunit
MTEFDALFIGEDPQIRRFSRSTRGKWTRLLFKHRKASFSPRRSRKEQFHDPVCSQASARPSRWTVFCKSFADRLTLNEGAYETRLVTNITKVEEKPFLPPPEGGCYTSADAAEEAGRCLQCDCMECVKVCEYLKHYGSYPRKYVREIYNNLSIIMRTRTANKMINSCTLCGLCGEVCPTDLDMGAVNYEVRQTMVKTSKMPVSAHDFALRDMAFSNSQRAALTLCADEKTTCSDLFFPGCQLSASNPEYIPLLYQSLASVLPDLGVMLRCCGAPADWSGEQELFAQTMSEFRRQWLELGNPRLVLACSSCQRMFKVHLPEAQTVSIWEVFGAHNLYPAGRAYGRALAVHDPCTSRYEEDWQNAVRRGLEVMGSTSTNWKCRAN